MSPVVQGTKDPDGRPLEWIHLEDFSPGIWDAPAVATAESSGTSQVQVPQPFGSCTRTGTWCCIDLAGGGLGPLPKMTATYLWPSSYFPDSGTVTRLIVTGLAVAPTVVGNQVIVICEGNAPGVHHYYVLGVLTIATNLWKGHVTLTGSSHTEIAGSPFPYFTRAAKTTPTTEPGSAVLTFPIWPSGLATQGELLVYPSPSARTAIGVANIATGHPVGNVFCFFNRIICACFTGSTWPVAVVYTDSFNFTTPPNSYAYKAVDTVLVAETPFGIGAMGSISTGELMLIKRRGGGVMVLGDIADPSSVIFYPGVQPTGPIYGRATGSLIGMVYCSDHMGAWVWNGGNTSQKISAQLMDEFFTAGWSIVGDYTLSANFGFYCEAWRNWILFSNNYLYNTTSGSWWRLYPAYGTPPHYTPRCFFHYVAASATDGGTAPGGSGALWAAPLEVATGHTPGRICLYKFTKSVSAQHYQWTSNPIHVTSDANRVVTVREVVVTASCPQSGASITLTVGTSATGESPFVETFGIGSIGTQPTPLRCHVGAGALTLNRITLQINADNETTGNWAPVIHSIDIGYQTRALVPSSN